MVLAAEKINKNYGIRQLFKDVSLYIGDGDKIGLVGINGTGKSTLLKIIAGEETADEGKITKAAGLQISYLSQNPVMDEKNTVLEQVLTDLPPEFQEAQEYEGKTILTKLGMTDFEQKIKVLSGGQRKRVALASALLHPADLLILDEPTNHLDSDMVIWLEERLRTLKGALLMITHDRYFLERVVNRIVELDRGELYTYIANYSRFLELKTQRTEYTMAAERKRQAVLRREYQWIMRGAKARGTKSRDRIQRYEELRDRGTPQFSEDTVQITALNSRLGKKIMELEDVTKSFDGRTVLQPFSYKIGRKDRIGIVGRNGVGKSTLLNLIAGKLSPDSGTIEKGSTVKIGYFTQESREMDPSMRMYDFINGIAHEIRTSEGIFTATQMLERFLFPGDMQYNTIGKLSGGERRRLYLLSILMEAPNVLLLDEPTNDLDIETLTILEDYLETFPGAVLVVSHDRYFLDKLADCIFEIRKDGEIRRYIGDFSDYLEKRKPEDEDEAKKAKPAPKIVSSKPQKLKFSYKEQREYDIIEDELGKLEEDLNTCQIEMERCGSDYVRLGELEKEKERLTQEQELKTERWLYLTELFEKIEAQKKQNQQEKVGLL